MQSSAKEQNITGKGGKTNETLFHNMYSSYGQKNWHKLTIVTRWKEEANQKLLRTSFCLR